MYSHVVLFIYYICRIFHKKWIFIRFVECIRARPLAALLAVEAPRARFLAGWAPAAPAPAAPPAPPAPLSPARALHASEAFLDCALAVVVATTESYMFFNEQDIRHGFEEEHR